MALLLGLSAAALGAHTAAAATCDEVRAKHAGIAGKSIKIGISPFSPGYEVADPEDPSRIIGFDPDMVQALTDCIGVEYGFEAMRLLGPRCRARCQAHRSDFLQHVRHARTGKKS